MNTPNTDKQVEIRGEQASAQSSADASPAKTDSDNKIRSQAPSDKAKLGAGFYLKVALAFLPAVIFLYSGFRFWFMTFGTALLTIDSGTGALGKHWWIFMLLGVIAVVIAFVFSRWYHKKCRTAKTGDKTTADESATTNEADALPVDLTTSDTDEAKCDRTASDTLTIEEHVPTADSDK